MVHDSFPAFADRPARFSPPTRVLPVIVGVGVCLRCIQWIWNTSYFHDEIVLLWNIRDKSFSQYLGPLANNQAAPPAFMQIEKWLFLLFKSDSERIMRLPALFASCLGIIMFAFVARRILRSWEAVLATFLFACSDKLTYFASMLKPYAVDVLVAIFLTWLAIEVGRTRSIRRWWVLCVVAAMAIWVSYPAILIFGGVSAALAVRFPGRSPSRIAVYITGNLIVAVPFLVLTRCVESAQHTMLMDLYWGNNFVDYSHPARIPLWFAGTLYKLCNFEMRWGGLYLLPLAIWGLIAMIRDGRHVSAAILIGPLAMNFVAAALHRYPFEGRVTLYLIASVFLLAAAGAGAAYDWIASQRRSASRVAASIPGGLTALIAVVIAIDGAIWPRSFSDYRPLVQAIRARAQNEDVFYAPFTAEFQYYWPGVGDRARLFGCDYADEIDSRRFWLVWSHPEAEDLRDLGEMRRWAATFATERGSYVAGGNYAYVYEITATPPHIPWRGAKRFAPPGSRKKRARTSAPHFDP